MTGSTNGRIHQISASNGGVPKLPLEEAAVDVNGVTVDRQADRRNHGGPERALCLYALERIEALRAEGHPIDPGSAGENVTTEGIDWDLVTPGSQLRLGEVEIEVTKYTEPCWKNAAWFADGDFTRMGQKPHPGWSRVYARVLSGGAIRPGDAVTLTPATLDERLEQARVPSVRWRPPAS